MKILLISFIWIFSFNLQTEEELYVIQIKGEITNVATEKKLKPGDQIKLTDELSIKEDSDAILYSNKRGRLQLSKLKNEAKPSGELYYIVKENLLVIRKSAISRSKPIIIAQSPSDFKSYFGDHYSISSIDYLKVNTKRYPLDEDHFFYLRYIYNGERVNKRIDYTEDVLILNKDKLFSLNGELIDFSGSLEVTLYYYELKKETSTMITSASFSFVDSQKIFEEIRVLKEILEKKDMSKVEIRAEVERFTKNEYGNLCFTCFWQSHRK